MAKKSGLGRGLSAILDDVEDAYKQDLDENSSSVKEINLSDIIPNPYQPRKIFEDEALKELSTSILTHGLLQPIVVVVKEDGYMLIAGERRLRASKLAGLDTIKAIVTDFAEDNLRELALLENIQRENLNPLELANSYKELIEQYGVTQDGLSEIIHKSRTQIANTIRLLKLSKYVQGLINDHKISQGHAKTLIGLDEDKQKLYADTIIGQKLSVRESEDLVKKLKPVEQIKNIKSSSEDVESFPDLVEVLELLKKSGFNIRQKKNDLIINFSKTEDIKQFLLKIQ